MSIYLTYTIQALYVVSYSLRIKIHNTAPWVSIKRCTKISHILCTALGSCRVGKQVRALMRLYKAKHLQPTFYTFKNLVPSKHAL